MMNRKDKLRCRACGKIKGWLEECSCNQTEAHKRLWDLKKRKNYQKSIA